ncbi:MAG: rSAM/selenodomain-associated transferase 1 [Cellvibrionaceae bacterium]|jgi:rSAM/selenodomain-associated transferase 1
MHCYPDIKLSIFTKTPQLGLVKTRMQPDLSTSFSVELHTALLNQQLSYFYKNNICPSTLWLSGDRNIFYKSLPQWQSLPIRRQQGNDLGARMAYAVERELQHHRGVILVGTDCPFINEETLDQVCQSLGNYDAVIIPALDGGYVLLAVKEYFAVLFQNISWGESCVFEQTLSILCQLSLTVMTLQPLPDIDRPEDLVYLAKIPSLQRFTVSL